VCVCVPVSKLAILTTVAGKLKQQTGQNRPYTAVEESDVDASDVLTDI